jgi:hypothetical protein
VLPNNGKLGVTKGPVRFQDSELDAVVVNGNGVAGENGGGAGGGRNTGKSGDSVEYTGSSHSKPRTDVRSYVDLKNTGPSSSVLSDSHRNPPHHRTQPHHAQQHKQQGHTSHS